MVFKYNNRFLKFIFKEIVKTLMRFLIYKKFKFIILIILYNNNFILYYLYIYVHFLSIF